MSAASYAYFIMLLYDPIGRGASLYENSVKKEKWGGRFLCELGGGFACKVPATAALYKHERLCAVMSPAKPAYYYTFKLGPAFQGDDLLDGNLHKLEICCLTPFNSIVPLTGDALYLFLFFEWAFYKLF